MKPAFKTTEIARKYGITPNTVRNWSRLYATHLSPTANPAGDKEERIFTQRDIAVFDLITQLRAEGFNHAQIAARLGETTISEAEIETHGNEISEKIETPQTAMVPSDVSATMLVAMTQTLQSVAERLVEREGTQVRRVNEHLERLALLVWILAALVIVLVAAVIALWVLK